MSIRTSGRPDLGPPPAVIESRPPAADSKPPEQSTALAMREPPQTELAAPRSVLHFGGISESFLQPRLQELGKIKIGRKGAERQSRSGGTYRVPEKIDHFLIVRNERGPDGQFIEDKEMMERIGKSVRELDISLLSNDPRTNFATYLGYYASRQCLCFGNGETAARAETVVSDHGVKVIPDRERKMVPCPCELFEQRKCKANGILSAQLLKSSVLGGIYKFRTTSNHTIRNIMSSLELIRIYTGGVLAGLPLKMTLTPRTVDVPSADGSPKQTTIYVVNIVYKGDVEGLQQAAAQAAELRLKFNTDVRLLEQRARLMLTGVQSTEDDADIQEEFYPESNEAAELPAATEARS